MSLPSTALASGVIVMVMNVEFSLFWPDALELASERRSGHSAFQWPFWPQRLHSDSKMREARDRLGRGVNFPFPRPLLP